MKRLFFLAIALLTFSASSYAQACVDARMIFDEIVQDEGATIIVDDVVQIAEEYGDIGMVYFEAEPGDHVVMLVTSAGGGKPVFTLYDHYILHLQSGPAQIVDNELTQYEDIGGCMASVLEMDMLATDSGSYALAIEMPDMNFDDVRALVFITPGQ